VSYSISSLLLSLSGWKSISYGEGLPEKAVIVMCPHTSNWDFVWGRLGTQQYRNEKR
jgi:1-acyl-sn-glycerol-3-phosphate acyltransferase